MVTQLTKAYLAKSFCYIQPMLCPFAQSFPCSYYSGAYIRSHEPLYYNNATYSSYRPITLSYVQKQLIKD